MRAVREGSKQRAGVVSLTWWTIAAPELVSQSRCSKGNHWPAKTEFADAFDEGLVLVREAIPPQLLDVEIRQLDGPEPFLQLPGSIVVHRHDIYAERDQRRASGQ